MMCIFGKVFYNFDIRRNDFRLEKQSKKKLILFCISLTYS